MVTHLNSWLSLYEGERFRFRLGHRELLETHVVPADAYSVEFGYVLDAWSDMSRLPRGLKPVEATAHAGELDVAVDVLAADVADVSGRIPADSEAFFVDGVVSFVTAGEAPRVRSVADANDGVFDVPVFRGTYDIYGQARGGSRFLLASGVAIDAPRVQLVLDTLPATGGYSAGAVEPRCGETVRIGDFDLDAASAVGPLELSAVVPEQHRILDPVGWTLPYSVSLVDSTGVIYPTKRHDQPRQNARHRVFNVPPGIYTAIAHLPEAERGHFEIGCVSVDVGSAD